MIRRAGAALGFALLLATPLLVRAEVNLEEPFRLVRALRVLQDEIVKGNHDAYRIQQKMMADLSTQLIAIESERWKDPRNFRAAVLYVLSGGDPGILRKLLGIGGLPGPESELTRGALAYAEGRDEKPRAHLLEVDARKLDPGIAAAVALVQSALVAKTDPKRAMVFLDQARLLSPGTLIEEAALRRQILLLPSAGQLHRLNSLLTRYTRRFGRSYYARAFWRQLAAEIAGLPDRQVIERLMTVETLSARLDVDDRDYFYLSLAQEGIARGKIELVRFASEQALQGTRLSDVERLRAQVFKAAALIVTDEYNGGLSILAGIEREKLPREEMELLDAALSVAHRIRRPPAPIVRSGKPRSDSIDLEGRPRELSRIGLSTIERAQTLMASVDELLSGRTR